MEQGGRQSSSIMMKLREGTSSSSKAEFLTFCSMRQRTFSP
jgi:hypothetical protein